MGCCPLFKKNKTVPQPQEPTNITINSLNEQPVPVQYLDEKLPELILPQQLQLPNMKQREERSIVDLQIEESHSVQLKQSSLEPAHEVELQVEAPSQIKQTLIERMNNSNYFPDEIFVKVSYDRIFKDK